MNNKIVILSFLLALTISDIKASQREEVMILSPLSHHHNLKKIDEMKDANELIEEIIKSYKTTDPYKLDELSDKMFEKNEFEESAKLLIISALYGHDDNRSFLADVEYDSLKYIRLSERQKLTEEYFYKLVGKVVNHLKSQAEEFSKDIGNTDNFPKEVISIASKDSTGNKYTFGVVLRK